MNSFLAERLTNHRQREKTQQDHEGVHVEAAVPDFCGFSTSGVQFTNDSFLSTTVTETIHPGPLRTYHLVL